MTKQSKTAEIVAVACDQGHYGMAHCSNCNKTLSEPYYEHKYKPCPFCKYTFTGIRKIPYPYGGSDFD